MYGILISQTYQNSVQILKDNYWDPRRIFQGKRGLDSIGFGYNKLLLCIKQLNGITGFHTVVKFLDCLNNHYVFNIVEYYGAKFYLKNAVFWNVAQCRSCVNRHFGGTYRLQLLGRKIRERGTNVSRIIARGFFYPEDGGDTSLQNVGSYKIYAAPYPRRRHSS
jgi:hypothetical protein